MSMIFETIQIGHLHPLLVHLPIGIILVAFALEMYNRFHLKSSSDEMVLFALGCAGFSALISLGTGWLLGEEGGFDEDLIFLHRWMAVAFTVTTILLFFLKRSTSARLNKFYLPVFIIVLILVFVTGHFGGNMTHGEDYLFKDTNSNEIIIKDVAEAKVHSDIIQPILDTKCVSCHNQSKIKGGLIMTHLADLMKGGESGSIFDSINEKPLLLYRMHLSIEDEEHMPPKGKVQLTAEEIELMEWWVANDHCFDCKTKDLKTSERLDAILASLEEDDSFHSLIAKDLEPAPSQWLEEMNASGITIYQHSENNPLLTANLFGEKNLIKQKLKALDDYAENIVELNLGNSQFNDTIADLISPFKHLTKLQVQNTSLSDNSLSIFEDFEFLESLNLYGTNISNAVFEMAQKIPSLKSLYLFETQITEAEIEKFQIDFPNITVQYIPKDTFKATYLSQPTIIAETIFFKDALEVQLESLFEGSDIFYTTDGSQPDTTSIKYIKPLILEKSVTINAVATKSGWNASKVSTESFLKNNISFQDIALNKNPAEKYSGKKGKTLIDLKRGSTNFVDGNWLGFEGTHFKATLTLEETNEISQVSVGALSAPASWIFFPTGFVIHTSNDGKNFKRVKSFTLPKQEPNNDVKLHFFDIEIPPTMAKFVRVEIKSQLKNPSWHLAPGGNSWLFIDEIVLN